MNTFPYEQQHQLQLQNQQAFYSFGTPLSNTAAVPGTSSQRVFKNLDKRKLQTELLKEKRLREEAERELEMQKKIVADTTYKMQCAYFMMFQMQETYKLNNYKQVLMMENSKLKGEIARIEEENERLSKDLELNYELDVESDIEEESKEGFDVNEIYSSKNELLLMALNYDMTSRQSPQESKCRS